MSARLTGVSPAVVARGLIAACDHFKVDPTEVMGHGAAANARAAVGAALVAVMPRRGPKDGAVLAVGTMLQVNPSYMSPAGLRQRNINAELLLDLAEAMKAAGLNPTEIRVERSRANAAKPKPPREMAPPKAKPEPRPEGAKPVKPAPQSAPIEPKAPAPVHVRPMKANVRRWTRQFLNAGWTPRDVARLFDLHVAQVKAVKLEAQHG